MNDSASPELATVKDTYSDFHVAKKSRHLYPTEWVIRTLLGTYPRLKLNTGGYPGAKLLDLGFGDCRNMPLLWNCGFDIFGVEITERIVEMARETLDGLGIEATLRVGRNAAIPFDEGTFEYVLACYSLYYVDKGTSFTDALREVHRVLRPGGAIIASLPAPNGFIVKDAVALGDGHIIVKNDIFGLRNGYVLRAFEDEADVAATFGALFDDVTICKCEDDFWGLQINYFIVVARARK